MFNFFIRHFQKNSLLVILVFKIPHNQQWLEAILEGLILFC